MKSCSTIPVRARSIRRMSTFRRPVAGSSTCAGHTLTPSSSSVTSARRPPPRPSPQGGGSWLANGRMDVVGAEVVHRLADPAVKGRERVHQVPQVIGCDFLLDRELEDAQDVAAAWADAGGADQHAAIAVGPDRDQPVVTGAVDPTAGGDRRLLDTGCHVDALLARLRLGQAGHPDLGVGEGYSWFRPVIRTRDRIAQDVIDHDVRVVD